MKAKVKSFNLCPSILGAAIYEKHAKIMCNNANTFADCPYHRRPHKIVAL